MFAFNDNGNNDLLFVNDVLCISQVCDIRVLRDADHFSHHNNEIYTPPGHLHLRQWPYYFNYRCPWQSEESDELCESVSTWPTSSCPQSASSLSLFSSPLERLPLQQVVFDRKNINKNTNWYKSTNIILLYTLPMSSLFHLCLIKIHTANRFLPILSMKILDCESVLNGTI